MKLSHPGGEEELIVVGIPGDRELDMKRLEAVVSPALAANATDEDMARRPELVKGYMGPKAAGPNRAPRDSDGNGGGLRLLLDPRVVEGSSWITGGDEIDTHYFGLVMGRDFTADGIIEAAEVRAGDPAPDGSGPLELARGIEVGHIFQLGRKYAESLGLTVLDENGKSRVVTMGSYGIGVSRVLAAMAEANHDDAGLAWPVQIAPYHVHVVATGKNREIFDAAETLAGELESRGVEVLYDDRPRVSAGVKFTDAELLGVPYMVVVGRGLADGVVEFRDRRSGERREVAVAEAAERLAAQVEEALRAAEI